MKKKKSSSIAPMRLGEMHAAMEAALLAGDAGRDDIYIMLISGIDAEVLMSFREYLKARTSCKERLRREVPAIDALFAAKESKHA
jgi:hypothetical protein